MKTNVFILSFIAALALCIPALAQSGEHRTFQNDPPTPQPIILTDQQGEYRLGRSMDILEDPSGELSIDQVASPEFASRFVRSQEDVPVFGYTNSAYWVRVRLRNESRLTNPWWLEFGYANTQYIDLYTLLPEGQGFSLKQSGSLRPFTTRDIPYQRVILSLFLPANSEQTVYLRVQSGASMTLSLNLWSPATFAAHSLPEQLLWGLYFGALLAMLAYNLFLYFRLKELNYLYLVILLASLILGQADFEGYTNAYFSSDLYLWKKYIILISFSLTFASIALFSASYLEVKTRLPKLQPVLVIILGFWGGLICIAPFITYGSAAKLAVLWAVVTLFYAVLANILTWIKGNRRQALFYSISWSGVIIGLLATSLIRWGLLPSNNYSKYLFLLGFVWMTVVWSLALADRIKLLQYETEDANRKLHRSERQLSQILERLPIGVVVYGKDRKPRFFNPRFKEIFNNPEHGLQPDLAAGRTLAQALKHFSFRIAGTDQDYPLERLPVSQAYEGKIASADDIEADLIDRRVSIEVSASPVTDDQGQVESVVATVLDITQRKKEEAELHAYRQGLEQLADTRTDELVAINAVLQTEIATRQHLEELLNLRMEWLVVVNQVNQAVVFKHDLPRAYQKYTRVIKRLFNANEAFLAEFDAQSKELKLLSLSSLDDAQPDLTGSMIPFLSSALSDQLLQPGKLVFFSRDQLSSLDGPAGAHFQDAKGQIIVLIKLDYQENIIGLLGLEFLEAEKYFSADEIALLEKICFDINQLRDKALQSEQSQASIVSQERNRLARDLHDSVTQVLFAASLVAEVLPQLWRRDPQKAQASLEELRHLTRGALAEMRTVLLELRPSSVTKTPLSDLLAQLAEAATSRTGLKFQLFIEQLPSLPEDVHFSFYRIAQESLNNVVKHAQASQVAISLSATLLVSDSSAARSSEVKLIVRDDGCGFVVQEQSVGSLGLSIMRERANAIDATLSVESQPGHGTTVTLTWHD